jgi:hypothetical protein
MQDDTVEGAITLMNKIGYIIDGRIADGNHEKAKKKTKSAATQY